MLLILLRFTFFIWKRVRLAGRWANNASMVAGKKKYIYISERCIIYIYIYNTLQVDIEDDASKRVEEPTSYQVYSS